MDSFKYYNDSLAYDFGMFEDNTAKKPKENYDNIVKISERNNKKNAAARRLSPAVSLVMLAVFILAALCGNIFLRLQINEVNSKISETKALINELKSEKTALDMEFERRISYANIELEATEMGMQKKDKSQVKYIRINDKNTATTKDGKNSISND